MSLNFDDPSLMVFVSPSSFTSWIAKIGTTGAVASLLEHNSAAASLAVLLDTIANPAATVVASHPLGYAFDVTYGGPNYQGWNMHGQQAAQVGLLPEPTDANARVWWDGIAELCRRLAWYTPQTASVTAPGQPIDTFALMVWGPAKAMCVPLWTDDGTKFVYTENPDAAAVLVTVLNGAQVYAARMQAIAAGSTDPSVTSSSSTELAALPQIQILANMYRAETTQAREIAGGAVLAGLVTTLVGVLAGK